MDDLQGLEVLVAGAGAVGSVTALTLLRCGAKVRLADPAPLGGNASGVAAGMLAPAFECLLDPVSAEHFPLLAVARDFWPDLADSLPGGGGLIERSGALYIAADGQDLEGRAAGLKAFDKASETFTPTQANALSPGLKAPRDAIFTALDWRLEPQAMLQALRHAFELEGGVIQTEAVNCDSPQAEVLVLATGFTPLPSRLPESGLLSPIKGQILRLPGAAPRGGPVVRAAGVYVAPSSTGAIVGATMQQGRSDLDIELDKVVALKAAAAGLFPALAGADVAANAGVRAATPDSLPLVGPSRGDPRIVLATGARRNGWLLAPVMADVVAARLRGAPAGVFGEAFDPARFAAH